MQSTTQQRPVDDKLRKLLDLLTSSIQEDLEDISYYRPMGLNLSRDQRYRCRAKLAHLFRTVRYLIPWTKEEPILYDFMMAVIRFVVSFRDLPSRAVRELDKALLTEDSRRRLIDRLQLDPERLLGKMANYDHEIRSQIQSLAEAIARWSCHISQTPQPTDPLYRMSVKRHPMGDECWPWDGEPFTSGWKTIVSLLEPLTDTQEPLLLKLADTLYRFRPTVDNGYADIEALSRQLDSLYHVFVAEYGAGVPGCVINGESERKASAAA